MRRYAQVFGMLAVAVMMFGTARADEAEDAAYFPLYPEAIWTYGDPGQVIRVSGLKTADRDTVFVLDGLLGTREVWVDAKGKVMEQRDGKTRLLFDLSAPEGASWEIEPIGDGGDLLDGASVHVVSRWERVAVPFGAFGRVLHLGLRPRPGLADAGITDLWFAPEVGLIKWSEIWIGGVRTHDLTAVSGSEALIALPEPEPLPPDTPVIRPESYDNEVSVERGGVRYEVATERETYLIGEVVAVRYRVTAVDRDSVVFRFGSSQQIDFGIEDAGTGERVWTWSATRLFLAEMTSITLRKGESETFETVVQLGRGFFRRMDPGFEMAPITAAGTYRVLAFMPSSAGLGEGSVDREDTEVSVPIQVEGQSASAAQLSGAVFALNEDGGAGAPLAGATVGLELAQSYGVGMTGVERTGEGMAGAETPVAQPADGAVSILPAYVTHTDAEGRFAFDGVYEGEYLVTARLKGYEPATVRVSLAAGRHEIRIGLEKATRRPFPNANRWEHNGLIAEMATDREAYSAEDSLRVRYRLVNRTSEDRKLIFRSGQQYDFVLDGPEGEFWRWSDGRMFPQVIGMRVLAPGDTLEVQETIYLGETGVRAGHTYALSGFLTVSADEPGAVDREETVGGVKFIAGDPDGVVIGPPLPPVSRRGSPAIRINREDFSLMDSVRVSYRFMNTGEDTLRLAYPSTQRYDLVLENEAGWVWTWASLLRFMGTPEVQYLAPGEHVEVEEAFYLPVVGADAAGMYVLRVYLTVEADTEDAVRREETEAAVKFRVGEPLLPGSSSGRATLSTDRDHYAPGDSVRVGYRFVNTLEEPVVWFRSGQMYDLVLIGPEEQEVWRWSDGKAFIEPLIREVIEPGEAFAFRETFAMPGVKAEGTHVLRAYMATIPAEPGVLSQVETEAVAKFFVSSSGAPGGEAALSKDQLRMREASDFNGDGMVNFPDFLMFAREFGRRIQASDAARGFDLDGNDEVDFQDFLIFATHFGKAR